MSRGEPVFSRAEIESVDAQALIAALDEELEERYPEEGANHFRLDPEEVAPGRGCFLIARVDRMAVACGAVRLNDRTTAEIKRMYTVPAMRGRGLARRLLDELIAQARTLGARRIVLETGERQTESLALYRKAGFVEIPLFGEYEGSPLSICMEKQL
ncbi:MAG TPA: GNAT family N-acetyltransferase [Kofleriaceae bacterium]|nr:GNAT family N-acetyltransferase [Kofleriaceae bacterium]